MGTNYYFTPKGYENLNEINKVTYKAINEIRDNYIKTIKDLIEASEKEHIIYKELLNNDVDLDNIRLVLQWEYDIPEIHICKISAGWNVCFEANEFYKNFKELELFYLKYKDDFIITDEYNRQFTFEQLIEKIDEHNDNSRNISHVSQDYDNYCPYNSYKDNYGYEWSPYNFS